MTHEISTESSAEQARRVFDRLKEILEDQYKFQGNWEYILNQYNGLLTGILGEAVNYEELEADDNVLEDISYRLTTNTYPGLNEAMEILLTLLLMI